MPTQNTTNIIVNLQIEGIHRWPAAREKRPEVGYLADPHRHMFHICCKKPVFHNDRDVEFILFKRQIIDYLERQYKTYDGYRIHDFRSMSCEAIAKELADVFGLCYCAVTEDGENGAEYFKDVKWQQGLSVEDEDELNQLRTQSFEI
ncbi:MAG: hypothetical protein JHC54_12040 [Acinetobacter sp.]|nr:hypothetical protein [Acinetobacter sp.]